MDILKLALAVLMAEKGVVKNEKSEENREERNQDKWKKTIKVTKKPTDEKLESALLATIILNISRTCTNHKSVWDKELKENDGIIPFQKYMEICKVRASADKIYEKYFEPTDDDIEDDVRGNFFYTEVMGKQAMKCLSGINETPILTPDDVSQKLPVGFMGTLCSWARMVKDLDTAKMKGAARRLGITENELNKIFNFSNKYMAWVYEEISFK